MHFEPTSSSEVGITPGVGGACRFTLEAGPLAGRAFTALLFICQNPCCPCGVVGFDCRNEHGARETAPSQRREPPAMFDLDVFARKLSPRKQSDPDGLALGDAFVAEAKAEQWEWLQRLFLSIKARHMRAVDLDSLNPRFPPEVVAGEATMVGYVELFPWSDPLLFTHDSEEWLVDDQYCVAPGCACTQTVLAFFRPSAASDQADGPAGCATALRYDYVRGKTELLEARSGSPSVAALVQGLRAAHPDLTDTLRLRHKQLQRLARRLVPKSRSRVRRLAAAAADLGLDPDDELGRPPAPTVRTAPKVGRNDACPCGSGKKYKKCCGSQAPPPAIQP